VADPVGVCVAFDDDALTLDPVWTRLDDPDGFRVAAGWSIQRGRQSELDKTGTGTATVALVDKTGVLDPTNAAGAFFDKLDPVKQAAIALTNPCTGVTSTLMRGHSSEWLGEFRGANAQLQDVTLELVDAFDLLAAIEMTPGHHGDTAPSDSEGDIYFLPTSGVDQVAQRLNKALDDAGWPTGLRRIFTGNVQLQASTYPRQDQLLTVCLDGADAEFPGVANFFMSKDSRTVFHGRLARFHPEDFESPDDASRSAGNSIVFWNVGTAGIAATDPTVTAISGLAWRRSKQDIINACLCLPKFVDESDVPSSLVTDSASIAKYGWRSVSFSDLLVLHGDEASPNTAVAETKLYSTYYVANYATPRTRVTQLRFQSRHPDSRFAPAIWALLCGVEIGDVIHLDTSHFAGAGGFNENYFIEGIRYDGRPQREGRSFSGYPNVTLTLDVSPAAFYATDPF
jgi:hypothetical protein